MKRKFLNDFIPRPYQVPIMDAIINKNYRKVIAVQPRRSGKDLTAWNIAIWQAMVKTCVVFYLFPTYSQAKKVIWDSITNSGKTFHDYIPSEAVKSKNSQELKITLKNGSVIQLIGSDHYDLLMGTNPYACIFSEYALQDPMAYNLIRPILSANGGWALFVSTPRGKSFFYDLFMMAKDNPSWFAYHLTLDDTKHVGPEELAQIRKDGLMSEDLIQQEFYCSWSMGVEGAYYTKYIDDMRRESRITTVPWDVSHKVNSVWDLGMRDSTVIIFFQLIGKTINIIDCYEDVGQGFEFYAKILRDKPYQWGKHIAPHDIRVRELGTGMSRYEKARDLGIQFTVAPQLSVYDGIESVRTILPKVWIDKDKCVPLIKALENYRKEFDQIKKVYRDKPLHNWSSHFCFTGSMKVKTPDGDIPIKNLSVGDYVLTPLGKRKILKVHKKLTNKLCCINDNITCTPDHKVFTQRKLVSADELSYTDVLEPYSIIRSFLWKKIFGYFTGEQDIKGFKKTISSLKMKNKSCLMDTFIHGMSQSIFKEVREELAKKEQLMQEMGFIQRCKDMFGSIIMVRYLKDMLSIIKTLMQGITQSKTSRCLQGKSMQGFMPYVQMAGVSQKKTKPDSERMEKKQNCGIRAKRVEGGIRSMVRKIFHLFVAPNTRKSVLFAVKSTQENNCGKNTAQTDVNQKQGCSLVLTMKIGIVAYAIRFLNAISIASKRHAVRSVQVYRSDIQEEVYDLTIENDNCYYINGYLVSNCDGMRYLAISRNLFQDGLTAEEIDRMYRESKQGSSGNLPSFFR